jgi:hypothetical protein
MEYRLEISSRYHFTEFIKYRICLNEQSLECVSLWTDEEYCMLVYHSVQDTMQWLYNPN